MMELSLTQRDSVFFYLSTFLTKTQAKQLTETISHSVKHHGLEFTVSYIKNMKVKFRNLVSDPTLPLPKGSWKPVFRLPPQKALQLLNIYTAEVFSDITQAQASKFIDAIKAQGPDFGVSNVQPEIISGLVKNLLKELTFPHPTFWYSNSSKYAPIWDQKGKIVSKKETFVNLLDIYENLKLQPDSCRDFMVQHRRLYAKAMGVTTNSLLCTLSKGKSGDMFNHPAHKEGLLDDQFYGGKLGVIQEKGGKLRVVANAFRHHQMVLKPLGDVLFATLKDLEYDCTFDQPKGWQFAQKSLEDGKTCYCYDLSNATDLFPLSYQIELIRFALIAMRSIDLTARPISQISKLQKESFEDNLTLIKQSLDVFEALARSVWYSPALAKFNAGSPYFKWETGQPLGLYPSFALFALSHCNFLREIERELNTTNTFRILGDDVIINDPKVASFYETRMRRFGCKISTTKSLISNSIAEFGGKIIHKDGVFNVLKWQHFSHRNAMGPINVLGLRGMPFIPPQYREQVALYSSLPEPVGLGLNPSGLSLEQRLFDDSILDLYYAPVVREKIRDTDLRYSDREIMITDVLNLKNLQDSPRNRDYPRFRGEVLPFDQKSKVTVVHRQHVNAVMDSLKPYEDVPPLVADLAMIDEDITQRSNLFDKMTTSIGKIRKYFRRFNRYWGSKEENEFPSSEGLA